MVTRGQLQIDVQQMSQILAIEGSEVIDPILAKFQKRATIQYG